MTKWSEIINHLDYADDTISFASTDMFSLQMPKRIPKEYEIKSGELINKEKNFIFAYHKTTQFDIKIVDEITGFSRGNFPLIHLGFPIGHAKKKKVHFSKLLKKVHNNLQAWKGKMLSFGGKAVLIMNVLSCIPIYLLFSITPPKCVLYDLYKLFTRFL